MLYSSSNLRYHMIVETLDGRIMNFLAEPARRITEDDLTEMPGYHINKKTEEEAPKYAYFLYKLQKA